MKYYRFSEYCSGRSDAEFCGKNDNEFDPYFIRITKVGDKDLSFLSINNQHADKTAKHEQCVKYLAFLK